MSYSHNDIASLLVKTFKIRANATSITKAKDFKRNSKYCFRSDTELISSLAERIDDTEVLSFASSMDIVYKKADELVFTPVTTEGMGAELRRELEELTTISNEILDRLNDIRNRLDRLGM